MARGCRYSGGDMNDQYIWDFAWSHFGHEPSQEELEEAQQILDEMEE